MVSPELVAILVVLIFQPLIALLWAYAVYRVAVNYTVSRAEKAVDGRINHATEAVENAVGGSE